MSIFKRGNCTGITSCSTVSISRRARSRGIPELLAKSKLPIGPRWRRVRWVSLSESSHRCFLSSPSDSSPR